MDLFGNDAVDDFHDEEQETSDFHLFDGDEKGAISDNYLQTPQNTDYLLGHEAVESEILSLWQSGRMPHSLILNGLKGIGKATFAYRLARFILKDSSEPAGNGLFGEEIGPESLYVSREDPVFSRVASGGHPDLMVVTRPFDEKKGQQKDEIPVDDIRKVAPFLRKTSSNGGWRVVIIDDANTMNRNGQNALLKILEEPPKNSLLLLVTHGAGGLIPTIRSRCRFVSLSPLSKDDLGSVLERMPDYTLLENDKEIISALAEGSAGHAIELLQNDGLGQINLILNALNELRTLSESQIDTIALTYGKSGNNDSVRQFVFILNWWLSMMIKMAAAGQKVTDIGNITLRLPDGESLSTLLHLHENVAEHIETCINGSLDKRYMIYKALRMVQG